MKLYIYTQQMSAELTESGRKLADLIFGSGIEYKVNSEYAPYAKSRLGYDIDPKNFYTDITKEDISADAVMLSIGGDGTFLETVRRLRGLPMPILGVNIGRLGFLAQLLPDDMPAALEELCKGNYKIEKRPLLKISGSGCDQLPFPYAFNEFTLHRHEASMIEIEAYADNDLLAVYRGDGIIIATPTGSTAYSLSAGGPILTPDCPALVMTALAPHNLAIRPVVMPDYTVFSFRVSTRGRQAIVFLDNMSCPVADGDVFTIEKAKFSAFLIRFQNISFYDTLRNKMMWGLDKRDSAG